MLSIDVIGKCLGNTESLEQWLKLVPVTAPTSNGGVVNWLAHLSCAGGENRPINLMEVKAGIAPFQTAKIENLARLRFDIGYYFLVLHVEYNTRRQYSMPMRCDLLDATVIAPEFAKIVRVRVAIEEKLAEA